MVNWLRHEQNYFLLFPALVLEINTSLIVCLMSEWEEVRSSGEFAQLSICECMCVCVGARLKYPISHIHIMVLYSMCIVEPCSGIKTMVTIYHLP